MKIAVAALVAMLMTTGLQATLLRYQFSGDADFSFLLDDRATPDGYVAGAETDFYDVAGRFGGRAKSDVYFYTSASGGGIILNDFDGDGVFLDATGPQLFSGDTMAPTLLLGQFDLLGFGGGSYHLSVAPVPEPASWALMVAGFGLALATLRRRVKIGVARST